MSAPSSKVHNLKVTVDAVDTANDDVHVYSQFEPVGDLDVFGGSSLEDAEQRPDVEFRVTDNRRTLRDDFRSNTKPYKNLNLEIAQEDILSLSTPENRAKRVARARRFGIIGTDQDFTVPEERLRQLYESLDIDFESVNSEDSTFRLGDTLLNVLHLHGVQHMNTPSIITYVSKYQPTHVDWVSDNTCNVHFKSPEMAVIALTNLTKAINKIRPVPEEGEILDEHKDVDADDLMGEPSSLDDVSIVNRGTTDEPIQSSTQCEDVMDVDVSKYSIPHGKWRVVVDPPADYDTQLSLLLVRYAHVTDTKQVGFRKGGRSMPERITSGSRKRKMELYSHSYAYSSDDEGDNDGDQVLQKKRKKTSRCRMRADDEQARSVLRGKGKGGDWSPSEALDIRWEEKLDGPYPWDSPDSDNPEDWTDFQPLARPQNRGNLYTEMLSTHQRNDRDSGLDESYIDEGVSRWRPPTDVRRMKVTVTNTDKADHTDPSSDESL